jgi:DNA-binding transcriptional LysR family regulator
MDLLLYLRTFVCLAEKGTMNKAMDILLYSQPTISTHISVLEKNYGCTLLEYQNKKYVLTEEGHTLYRYASKLLSMASEIEVIMKEFQDLNRGTFYLGASSNIGVYTLPKILGIFHEMYPHITIKVTIDKTREIERMVEDHLLNVAIVEADVSENANLIVELLQKEPLILIASPTHPWAKRGTIKLGELLEESFIVGEPGSGTRRVLERQIGDIINHVKISLELGSTEAVKKAVENSLGVSIIVKSAATRELQTATLVEVPIENVLMFKEYKIIYSNDKYLTSGTKKFLNLLRSLYSISEVNDRGERACI